MQYILHYIYCYSFPYFHIFEHKPTVTAIHFPVCLSVHADLSKNNQINLHKNLSFSTPVAVKIQETKTTHHF